MPLSGSFVRADDGIRTHDIQLGKLALYQLSYVRLRKPILAGRKKGSGAASHMVVTGLWGDERRNALWGRGGRSRIR
jgi:hypothetical protein